MSRFDLPPVISEEDWLAHQAAQFATKTDQQINDLSSHGWEDGALTQIQQLGVPSAPSAPSAPSTPSDDLSALRGTLFPQGPQPGSAAEELEGLRTPLLQPPAPPDYLPGGPDFGQTAPPPGPSGLSALPSLPPTPSSLPQAPQGSDLTQPQRRRYVNAAPTLPQGFLGLPSPEFLNQAPEEVEQRLGPSIRNIPVFGSVGSQALRVGKDLARSLGDTEQAFLEGQSASQRGDVLGTLSGYGRGVLGSAMLIPNASQDLFSMGVAGPTALGGELYQRATGRSVADTVNGVLTALGLPPVDEETLALGGILVHPEYALGGAIAGVPGVITPVDKVMNLVFDEALRQGKSLAPEAVAIALRQAGMPVSREAVSAAATQARTALATGAREAFRAGGRAAEATLRGIQDAFPDTSSMGRFGIAQGLGQQRPGDISQEGFYSQLRRVIEQKMPNRASPAQIRALASPQNGVKPDELKWSGLDDFLANARPDARVEKQDLLAYLDQNQVQVRDVLNTEIPPSERRQPYLLEPYVAGGRGTRPLPGSGSIPSSIEEAGQRINPLLGQNLETAKTTLLSKGYAVTPLGEGPEGLFILPDGTEVSKDTSSHPQIASELGATKSDASVLSLLKNGWIRRARGGEYEVQRITPLLKRILEKDLDFAMEDETLATIPLIVDEIETGISRQFTLQDYIDNDFNLDKTLARAERVSLNRGDAGGLEDLDLGIASSARRFGEDVKNLFPVFGRTPREFGVDVGAGAVTGGVAAATGPEDQTPEERARSFLTGFPLGFTAGRAARGLLRGGALSRFAGAVAGGTGGAPQLPRETAEEAYRRIDQMYNAAKKAPQKRTALEEAAAGKWTKFRAQWDAGMPVKRVQDLIFDGQEPTPEENAYALFRLMAGRSKAADTAIQEELIPIIQNLTKEEQRHLINHLTMMDNTDKARSVARRVTAEVLDRPLPGVAGETALRQTERSLAARQRVLSRYQDEVNQTRLALSQADQRFDAERSALDPQIRAARSAQSGFTQEQADAADQGLEALNDARSRLAAAQQQQADAIERSNQTIRNYQSSWNHSDPAVRAEARAQVQASIDDREVAAEAVGTARAELASLRNAASQHRWQTIARRYDPDIEAEATARLTPLREQRAQAQIRHEMALRGFRRAESRERAAGRRIRSSEGRLGRLRGVVDQNRANQLSQRIQTAASEGVSAEKDRLFSGEGGVHAFDEAENLRALEQNTSPESAGKIKQAADQVWNYSRSLRDRLHDAGLIDDETYQDWSTNFPHYIKTEIEQYLSQADSERIPTGKPLLTVGQLRSMGLTKEGTAAARVNPLNTLIRQSFATENLARRNEAAQAILKLRERSPELQQLLREMPGDYSLKNDEAWFSVYDKGKQRRFVGPKDLEQLWRLNPSTLPTWARWAATAMGTPLLKAGATGLNMAFILPNALRDAQTYMTRTGGFSNPKQLGRSAAELGRAYVDLARQGITGKRIEDLSELHKAGAGQFSEFSSMSPEQMIRRLTKTGALGGRIRPISTKEGLQQLIQDTIGAIGDVGGLPFEPVRNVGEMVETAPRLAAARLAKKGGASTQEAAMQFRDITMDFARGGDFAKTVNQFIPFFNAAMQAPERFLSMDLSKKNRMKTLTALGTAVLLPTIAAESYNRAFYEDDYEDVPDYLKDNGWVIMLPGDVPRNEDGSKGSRPFAWIPRPQHVNFLASAVKRGMEHQFGDDHQTWGSTWRSLLGGVSPVNLDAVPLPPTVRTTAELLTNKDLFRDREIVPEQLQGLPPEEQYTTSTSALGRGVGRLIHKPPTAIDYAVTSLGGGVGRQGLNLSNDLARLLGLDAAEPARAAPVLDIPVAREAIGSILRRSGGQQTTNAIALLDRQMQQEKASIRDAFAAEDWWKELSPPERQAILKREMDEIDRRYAQDRRAAREAVAYRE